MHDFFLTKLHVQGFYAEGPSTETICNEAPEAVVVMVIIWDRRPPCLCTWTLWVTKRQPEPSPLRPEDCGTHAEANSHASPRSRRCTRRSSITSSTRRTCQPCATSVWLLAACLGLRTLELACICGNRMDYLRVRRITCAGFYTLMDAAGKVWNKVVLRCQVRPQRRHEEDSLQTPNPINPVRSNVDSVVAGPLVGAPESLLNPL